VLPALARGRYEARNCPLAAGNTHSRIVKANLPSKIAIQGLRIMISSLAIASSYHELTIASSEIAGSAFVITSSSLAIAITRLEFTIAKLEITSTKHEIAITRLKTTILVL
jgi:hypothetical protein